MSHAHGVGLLVPQKAACIIQVQQQLRKQVQLVALVATSRPEHILTINVLVLLMTTLCKTGSCWTNATQPLLTPACLDLLPPLGGMHYNFSKYCQLVLHL